MYQWFNFLWSGEYHWPSANINPQSHFPEPSSCTYSPRLHVRLSRPSRPPILFPITGFNAILVYTAKPLWQRPFSNHPLLGQNSILWNQTFSAMDPPKSWLVTVSLSNTQVSIPHFILHAAKLIAFRSPPTPTNLGKSRGGLKISFRCQSPA